MASRGVCGRPVSQRIRARNPWVLVRRYRRCVAGAASLKPKEGPMYLKLENIGSMPLHGRMPGEVWTVEVGDDGKPVNKLWKKRLDDEDRHKCGVVAVVGLQETAEIDAGAITTPQPKAAESPRVSLAGLELLISRIEALERAAPPDCTKAVSDMAGRLKALEEAQPHAWNIKDLMSAADDPAFDDLRKRVDALEAPTKTKNVSFKEHEFLVDGLDKLAIDVAVAAVAMAMKFQAGDYKWWLRGDEDYAWPDVNGVPVRMDCQEVVAFSTVMRAAL